LLTSTLLHAVFYAQSENLWFGLNVTSNPLHIIIVALCNIGLTILAVISVVRFDHKHACQHARLAAVFAYNFTAVKKTHVQQQNGFRDQYLFN
jgi:uncharacterized membrane protein